MKQFFTFLISIAYQFLEWLGKKILRSTLRQLAAEQPCSFRVGIYIRIKNLCFSLEAKLQHDEVPPCIQDANTTSPSQARDAPANDKHDVNQ